MYNNPIAQQLNQTRSLGQTNNLQPIKYLMNQVRAAQNPQQMLQSIIAKNPQLQSFMNLAHNNGVSLEQVARMLAQQKGVDINTLINELNTQ